MTEEPRKERGNNGTVSPELATGWTAPGKAFKAVGHLVVEDLEVRYGEFRALVDVSLVVQSGSITGRIGPNGSGKSTLLNAVTGIQPVASGRIELDGVDLGELAAYRRARLGVARTFQTLRLFNSLSVIDNVTLGGHRLTRAPLVESVLRTPRSRKEAREQERRAKELMSVFGTRLLPRVSHLVSSLSYANRRRVEISRALMAEPSLLLLDEPMAGMNPNETWELAEQLPELQEAYAGSVLLIEHKMDVIAALCPHIYVLDHGTVLAEGDAESVQSHPEVVEAFLGVE